MNSAFRTFRLVNSEVISKVLFFSEQSKRKEIASCFATKVMSLPASYSACVVYTKTTILKVRVVESFKSR